MPLQVLQSSNINEIISDLSPPVDLDDGLIGSINDASIFVWSEKNISIYARTKEGSWQLIDNLKNLEKHSAKQIFWEDYYAVKFVSNTGNAEKVYVFPISVTTTISKSSNNYIIDQVDLISDLPDKSAGTKHYYRITGSVESEVVLASQDDKNRTPVDFNNTHPIITDVNPKDLVLTMAHAEINKSNIVNVEGSCFEPSSKVYVYEGLASTENLSDIENSNYATNIVGGFSDELLYADILDIKSDRFFIVDPDKITVSGSISGKNYFGYRNPSKLSVRFDLSPNAGIVDPVAYDGTQFSIAVQNENGEIYYQDNCIQAVWTYAATVNPQSLNDKYTYYNNNLIVPEHQQSNYDYNISWDQATGSFYTNEEATLDPTLRPNGVEFTWNVDIRSNNTRIYKFGLLYGDVPNYWDLTFETTSPNSATDFLAVWHKTQNDFYLYSGANSAGPIKTYPNNSSPNAGEGQEAPPWDEKIDGNNYEIDTVFYSDKAAFNYGKITYYIQIVPDSADPSETEGTVTFGYVNPLNSTRTDLATFTEKADLTKTVRGMLISYENTIYDIYLRPL